MQIYKIFHAKTWGNFQQSGESPGAPVDLHDGFIHFSTATQLEETANKHFTGVHGLILVAFEADAMADTLKWEPSRGGKMFPHLYGRVLRLEEVLWAKPLPIKEGAFVFPEGII